MQLELVLLWLWYRLAVAALIQPLAWELPYAAGVPIERKKKLFGLNLGLRIGALKQFWKIFSYYFFKYCLFHSLFII